MFNVYNDMIRPSAKRMDVCCSRSCPVHARGLGVRADPSSATEALLIYAVFPLPRGFCACRRLMFVWCRHLSVTIWLLKLSVEISLIRRPPSLSPSCRRQRLRAWPSVSASTYVICPPHFGRFPGLPATRVIDAAERFLPCEPMHRNNAQLDFLSSSDSTTSSRFSFGVPSLCDVPARPHQSRFNNGSR